MPARLLLLALAAVAMACAHGGEADIATLASNSDQIIWEAGQKAAEKKHWESARQHFKRIIDGFPQSEFGPAARIALGDSYFAEGGAGNYILAISAYRDFLTLYPSHPRSDYAQYRVAESYFRQRNGADRDQTNTQHALEEYERLLELYPGSSNIEATRNRVRECRQILARAEHLVGYFYQRTRQAWRAAVNRYEAVLKDFPDYAALDEVLFRLAETLKASGREAEALPHLDRLLKEYPESAHAADARSLMDDIKARVDSPAAPVEPPAPAPTPTPTPTPGSP